MTSISERASVTGTGSPAATGVASPAGLKFRVKAHVTRTLLKPVENVAFFVQPEAPIKDASKDEDIEGVRRRRTKVEDEAPTRQPPRLMDIIELESGECMTMIVPVVLETELKRFYANDSYVGKNLRLCRLSMVKKSGGEGYSRWSIQEIEIEDDEPEAAEVVDNSAKKGKKN